MTSFDRDLALRAKRGDEDAFKELVRRYETAAYRLARRITGDPAEAEDAVQEAFLRAYRALPRFDPERPFGPWILKIAANRALTRAGRRKRELPLEAAGDRQEGSSMEEVQCAKSEVERLRSAMRGLSALDRSILSLRYDQGLPVAEIAEILRIGLSAAKVRLFRARERLMRLMKGEGSDDV